MPTTEPENSHSASSSQENGFDEVSSDTPKVAADNEDLQPSAASCDISESYKSNDFEKHSSSLSLQSDELPSDYKSGEYLSSNYSNLDNTYASNSSLDDFSVSSKVTHVIGEVNGHSDVQHDRTDIEAVTAEKSEIEDKELNGINDNNDAQKSDDEKETKLESKDEETTESEDGWIDILGTGDLKKKILVKGEGKSSRPDRGEVVIVNIRGVTDNDVEVDCHDQFSFTVGDAEVVQGLDLAIPLMEKGETAEIVVKSRFAYGSQGWLPKVQPNATITYTVELLDIKEEPEANSLTIVERLEIGSQKREKGNFWYGRNDYSQALQCYRRSMDFLDDDKLSFSGSQEELKKMLDAQLKVYNNMAAAQLKMDAFDAALSSVNKVLQIQPNNVKALFRKGKILAAKGVTTEAISILKQALQLEPETKIIHQELSKLVEKRKTESKTERELYKRMLGQNQAKENSGSRSRLGFASLGMIIGSLAAVAIGVFAYRQYHGGW